LYRLSEARPRPTAVQLARPRPLRPAAYGALFAAPVRFAAEVSRVSYGRSAALAPFRDTSHRLREILAEHADLEVARYRRDDTLTDGVRAQIEKVLGEQPPNSAAIARALGLSERTLRRRLQTEGDGFRDLVDDVRRERALSLIRDGEFNVGELAARCGFGDGAAFARAFKRWTGRVPSQTVRPGRPGER
jgi:AraC-like DNA-binding protein